MRGQKTTTLKGVFRVSKNSDVPIGKDANARPMRMTRSRSAALATVAEEEVVEKPVTRKRKLTEDPAAPTLPAPKKQQLARTETATP
ncbi:hypothetical protein GGH93_005905, partial [Coemansia aciculifera]